VGVGMLKNGLYISPKFYFEIRLMVTVNTNSLINHDFKSTT